MKRVTRFGVGVLIGVCCAYSLFVFGLRWWLSRSYPEINFTITPIELPDPYIPSAIINEWPMRELERLRYALPPRWSNKRSSRGSAMWEGDGLTIALFSPNRLNFRRYKRSLRSPWNLMGLVDRVILMPRLDSDLKIYEQRMGRWAAFIYSSKEKQLFDLFDGNKHVTVLFVSNRPSEASLERQMKDIISTIEVVQGSLAFPEATERSDDYSIFSNL